jgi:hypothetical protein
MSGVEGAECKDFDDCYVGVGRVAGLITSQLVSEEELSSFARWTAEGGCPHMISL